MRLARVRDGMRPPEYVANANASTTMSSMFPDRFNTARLLLRPVEKADARAIFDGYATDPVVSRYLTWRPHRGLSDTDACIARCGEASSSRTYAVIEREDGCLIGVFDLRRTNTHCVGFGYALARHRWGQGLATEALLEGARNERDG